MDIEKFKTNTLPVLNFVKKTLPNTTYISVLLFKKDKLIYSNNNNYNGWSDAYSDHDMLYDNVFLKIVEVYSRNLEDTNSSVCIWNNTPHDSDESLEINKRRVKYGLYNGITLLEKINDELTLGINLTSNNIIAEDIFYSRVFMNRKKLINFLLKSAAP
jgi:hypothetical protein